MDWKYLEAFQEPINNQVIYIDLNGETRTAIYKMYKDSNGLPYGQFHDIDTDEVLGPVERWTTLEVVF